MYVHIHNGISKYSSNYVAAGIPHCTISLKT